jgi:hypothetical protein
MNTPDDNDLFDYTIAYTLTSSLGRLGDILGAIFYFGLAIVFGIVSISMLLGVVFQLFYSLFT